MSKRNHGEGSVFRRKDGRWQASIQIDGKRKTVYGSTKREAQAKLKELKREIDQHGGLVLSGGRTVNDLFDAWLDSAPNLKPSTVANYRLFANKWIRPALGDLRLDKVTPDRVQRFYAELKPSIAEKVHRILHRAFEIAILWQWMAHNPCARVIRPQYKPKATTVWNQAELERFLSETKGHWLFPCWVLLLSTGCRIGEAHALAWEIVDLENAVIQIDRTLHRIDGKWHLDTAKTESSVRTIALPQVALDAILRQKEQQASWKDVAGSEWEEWGLVFTARNGTPIFRSTVRHAIQRECSRLGLPDMTLHGLRHLHASLLLDEGVPITAVSARLGHANPQITMKIYAHALPGQDRHAADAIGDVLGRGEEGEADSEE